MTDWSFEKGSEKLLTDFSDIPKFMRHHVGVSCSFHEVGLSFFTLSPSDTLFKQIQEKQKKKKVWGGLKFHVSSSTLQAQTATKSHYLFYSVQAVKFPLIITFEATAIFGRINIGMLFCD